MPLGFCLKKSSAVLEKIYEKAYRTACRIQQKESGLKSKQMMEVQDREELQSLANTLKELENLTDRLIKNQTALRMFSKMSKIFIHNLNFLQIFQNFVQNNQRREFLFIPTKLSLLCPVLL